MAEMSSHHRPSPKDIRKVTRMTLRTHLDSMCKDYLEGKLTDFQMGIFVRSCLKAGIKEESFTLRGVECQSFS